MRKDNVSVKNVKTINTQTGEVKQRRVETTTLDERPSIWNLQAFAIVFLFIMLATTINVYSANNDNLTWIDSNGDFKLDSYDHSMINLDTDLLELNNQSLNDVFVDGNYLTFEIGQNYNGYDIVVDTENNSITWKTNSSISFLGITPPLITTLTTYYIRFNILGEVGSNYRHSFGNSGTITEILDYQNQSFSYIRDRSKGNRKYFEIWTDGTTAGSSSTFANIYLVNLDVLGLNNLTKDEMDSYYDLYVSLQENRLEAYKDLGNEPISQWQNLTQHLQLVIDAVMGPINNINDWINKFMQGMLDLIERR